MKYLISFALVAIFFHCGIVGGDENNDDLETALLGLAATRLNTPSTVDGEIQFNAILNGKNLVCGDTSYTLPGGQNVQIRDFRFFVQDIQLIRTDGTKVKVQMKNVDKYQIVNGENQVAMIDFSEVGSGKCTGTSDDDTTNKKILASIPTGSFKGYEITLGVPNALNHQDPTQQPANSPLRSATGLTWSWQAGYKFTRIELDIVAPSTNRFVLHVGSTNCTGDISIPYGTEGSVSCANPYRPVFTVEPSGGFDPLKDTITIDADEFFKGNPNDGQTVGMPSSYFSDGTSLSCMPIGNGTGTGGTPETCGPIIKNMGLVPGTKAGFSSTINTETGVGTVNPSTRQSIFKVIR